MCLAIPGRILSICGEDPHRVLTNGAAASRRPRNTQLYVLLHDRDLGGIRIYSGHQRRALVIFSAGP